MRIPTTAYIFVAGAAMAAVSFCASAYATSAQRPQVIAQADQNSSNKKKRTTEPGLQIACTRVGCNPIPRGCWIEKEFGFDGLPTGYDLVVCPRR